MCSLADGCTASLTKDFPARKGAFVGVRDPGIAETVIDLAVLAYGDGMDEAANAELTRALLTYHEGITGAAWRVARVAQLCQALADLDIPVAEPAGGHAVFVDAAEVLDELPRDADPATTLCAALYEIGGVRAGAHMGTSRQKSAGVRWIRLALPLGIDSQPLIRPTVDAFARVMADKSSIVPLKPAQAASRGRLGEFTGRFERA
jgi:tryptophanase